MAGSNEDAEEPRRPAVFGASLESADVVVIGGGAMGASVAFQLGVTDVVVLERETLASGSTSRSAGGFRVQFADELNVRIALRSIAELERFAAEIDLRQHGYLFLLDDERDLARFREAVELQNALGAPSRVLTVDEAVALVPQLATEGLVGATFCARDGTCTPEALVHAYARGIDVRQGCPVERIVVRDGRIQAVETSRGRIATTCVVCCAGVWSPEIARTAGVEIPVVGEARHMWFTPAAASSPAVRSGCSRSAGCDGSATLARATRLTRSGPLAACSVRRVRHRRGPEASEKRYGR